MDFETKDVVLGASILYSLGCEIINFNPALKSNSILEVVLRVLGVISGNP